jgi:hypothetical protein
MPGLGVPGSLVGVVKRRSRGACGAEGPIPFGVLYLCCRVVAIPGRAACWQGSGTGAVMAKYARPRRSRRPSWRLRRPLTRAAQLSAMASLISDDRLNQLPVQLADPDVAAGTCRPFKSVADRACAPGKLAPPRSSSACQRYSAARDGAFAAPDGVGRRRLPALEGSVAAVARRAAAGLAARDVTGPFFDGPSGPSWRTCSANSVQEHPLSSRRGRPVIWPRISSCVSATTSLAPGLFCPVHGAAWRNGEEDRSLKDLI